MFSAAFGEQVAARRIPGGAQIGPGRLSLDGLVEIYLELRSGLENSTSYGESRTSGRHHVILPAFGRRVRVRFEVYHDSHLLAFDLSLDSTRDLDTVCHYVASYVLFADTFGFPRWSHWGPFRLVTIQPHRSSARSPR